MEFTHQPIMLQECLVNLNIKPDGVYVDMTLGGAGHSSEILKRLSSGGLLIGIDQDENAILAANKRLVEIETDATFQLFRTNFENLEKVLENGGFSQVDGILMDLGVSSHQLDEADRGFSYQHDARLDMRMDNRNALSAYEVVNEWSQLELTRMIREYGEDKWAARIASFIVTARADGAIQTTARLVEVIKAAVPAAARREGPHPAKRTFQAIRIAVNRELEVLENTLDIAIRMLKPKGRLVVITFHSLEDRIVKKAFNRHIDGCTCPKNFPVCVCGFQPSIQLVFRKPQEPSELEITGNPRARSAKLRVIEKLE